MTGGHQVNQTFLIVVAHWLSLLPPIPPAPPVAGGIFPAVVTRPAAMDPGVWKLPRPGDLCAHRVPDASDEPMNRARRANAAGLEFRGSTRRASNEAERSTDRLVVVPRRRKANVK